MQPVEISYAKNHRHQQLLVLGISLTALLLALAPRQERSLFITQGTGLKAFGAALPPVDFANFVRFPIDYPGDALRRAFFVRTPGPTGPGGVGGDDGLAPAGPTGGGGGFVPDTPAAPAGDGPGFQPAAFTGGEPGGGGFPFSPPTLGAPGASPAGPTAVPPTDGTPPATVTPPVVAPPVDVAPPVPVVPAVPEPGTWLMMIVGFLGVGAALRRDRYRIGHQPRST